MEQLIPLVAGFGPVAFGTVVLIVVWKVIVRPELDTRRVEMEAFKQQLEALHALNERITKSADMGSANTSALTLLVESQRELIKEMRAVVALARADRAG